MNRLLIIKLGGSVITDKDSRVPKLNREIINNLSKEVGILIDQGYRIILVHGAGSFGHPLTKRYGLHEGMFNDKQRFGFSEVSRLMVRLNDFVVSSLLKHKVRALGVSPRSLIRQNDKKLTYFNTSFIEALIEQGFVPVLHGDLVLDDKTNCSVVSGDVQIAFLANKLKPGRVIFLSDVDGVFETNPKTNPKAKLIAQINDSNIEEVVMRMDSSGRGDVTGEMQGKILSLKVMKIKSMVIITNGLVRGNLVRAVGQSPIGTTLLFD